MCNT